MNLIVKTKKRNPVETLHATSLLIIAVLLLSGCFRVCAQTKISNIWSEVQNNNVAVHYTLVTRQPADLSLQYSIDDGQTWRDCNSVTGDLRTQITGNKTIIWDCRQDGFEKGNLLFRVIAPTAINPNLYKKNVFGLDLGYGLVPFYGISCMDFGIRYTRNFSPYIGWDNVVKFKYYFFKFDDNTTWGTKGYGSYTQLQAMTGLRAYTPAFAKNVKGYASLKAGYAWFVRGEIAGVAGEAEIGVYLAKNFLIGFGLLEGEYANSIYRVSIGLRIGFSF